MERKALHLPYSIFVTDCSLSGAVRGKALFSEASVALF